MSIEERRTFIDATWLFSYLTYSPIFSDHLSHPSLFLVSFAPPTLYFKVIFPLWSQLLSSIIFPILLFLSHHTFIYMMKFASWIWHPIFLYLKKSFVSSPKAKFLIISLIPRQFIGNHIISNIFWFPYISLPTFNLCLTCKFSVSTHLGILYIQMFFFQHLRLNENYLDLEVSTIV